MNNRIGTLGFSHTPLLVEHVGVDYKGRTQYRLTEDLVLSWQLNGGGLHVIVPAGFRTDFASIPRWLWWLFRPDGQWAPIAVAHDYLYGSAMCSRFLADACFRDGMACIGVPLWTRIAMFYGVRLFGGRRRKR